LLGVRIADNRPEVADWNRLGRRQDIRLDRSPISAPARLTIEACPLRGIHESGSWTDVKELTSRLLAP